MSDIIEIYKSRLINISTRNKSVLLRKIYKKSHFDLMSFNKFNEETAINIYDFIISRKDNDIEIMGDPYKKREGFDKIIKVQPKEKQELLKVKAQKLFDEMISVTGNLNTLIQNISATEKETGRNELYIGYPFAEGLCKDQTFLRGPILLFPVSLERKKDIWKLSNSLEQPILLNKSFVFAYSKCNEEKLGQFDMEFESLERFGDDFLVGLQKFLDDNNIKLILEDETNTECVEIFSEMSRGAESIYSSGNIQIKRYMILGQYPVSGSIYDEYSLLENKLFDNSLIKGLLINQSSSNSLKDFELSEVIKNEDIEEKEFYFLSRLDNSQEKALALAYKLSNLVIFGPPGTGKSQTLSNIVADSLCKGKRVLVISQKRAAIDVVYNRLADVSEKLMLVHDSNKDKKSFYLKVLSALKDSLNYSNEDFKDFKNLSVDIDSKMKLLSNLADTLHCARPFGLTLQQMYSKSKKIIDSNNEKIPLLSALKKDKVISNLNYNQLCESLNKLQGELLKDFIEKKILDTNFFTIDAIKDNYDIINRNELESFLNNLNSGIEKLTVFVSDEPFKSIIQNLCNNNFNVDDLDIIEKSMEFFKKENDWLNDPIKDQGISAIFNLFKNKKQEKENKEKYIKNEIEHKAQTNTIISELRSINEIIFKNNEFVKENFLINTLNAVFNKALPFSKYQSNLIEASDNIIKYRRLKKSLEYYQNFELNLFEFCYNNSSSNDFETISNILAMIEEISILNQINIIESSEKAIDIIDSYNIVKKDISDLMQQKNCITVPCIKSIWSKTIKDNRNSTILKEMERVANLKRKRWTLRRYISEFQELLFELFPCWLMSPETVSEIMPLNNGLFDMVLFDEASQMFIEDAIPSVYRAKKVVVVGDDKQLQPSRGITSSYDDEEDDDYNTLTQSAKEAKSLLDLAKVNFQKIMLNYHYRSKYEELINFSNHAFYEGRLQTSPNIVKSDAKKASPPIKRIKTDGIWDKNSNHKEAETVVALIGEILETRKEEETIGVITFNVHQKDLIMELLEKRAATDIDFSILYNREMARTNSNEDISLFIKNIENVQGDERDIIIFSTAYAKNLDGRVSVNFGTLSQNGGENRLNVAVSRAKKGIYLITSIEPEELKVDNVANIGPKLFKKYLEYAKYISESRYIEANELLFSLSDVKKHENSYLHFDSPFETEVYDELTQLGYKVDTQIGVSGYKIDLAVYSEEKEKYILGIECDGAAYHSSKSARERDIQRQIYLESMGWTIARIWSRNWWMDKSGEIKKIDDLLKTLC